MTRTHTHIRTLVMRSSFPLEGHSLSRRCCSLSSLHYQCVRLSSPFKLSFISFTCICLQVTRALRRLWHVTLFIFLRAILCAPALPKIHHKYPFPSSCSSPCSHCTVAFLIDTSLHSCLLSLSPSLHSRECKLDVVKGLVTIFFCFFLLHFAL